MHFSHLAGGPGKKENTFGNGGLTCIDVSGNPYISEFI
jgi:hypothetical protein